MKERKEEEINSLCKRVAMSPPANVSTFNGVMESCKQHGSVGRRFILGAD